MNSEKYTFAVKMVNEIKLQVQNDTWYGTLRHESFTEKFIEQISKSHYFIDAGAEFGFYTWLALKHMPKDGKILAFEPEIERFIALEQALAPFDLVSVYPHALAECEKKIVLYKQSKVHSATIDKDLSQAKDVTPCESFTSHAVAIDTFLADDINRIDIVKMDIEGAEIFAFQGMQEMLSLQKAHIFMEVHEAYVESCYRGGMNIMRKMIESNNYAIYSCNGCTCTRSALAGRVYIAPKADLV
ncbi:FkbM family methyltransferase [Desulfovibrio desulfuricans]|uniref:FkbM family methyltransferase n=1 Tax=Desulfovibrio desulfuricans TaxID=876 RepID=UPI0039840CC4